MRNQAGRAYSSWAKAWQRDNATWLPPPPVECSPEKPMGLEYVKEWHRPNEVDSRPLVLLALAPRALSRPAPDPRRGPRLADV